MKNVTRVLFCLMAMVMLAGHSSGVYAEVAGHVQFVNGVVQITNTAGQTRLMQKGDAVSEGDTLSSAPAASAQIKMRDGGLVAMRSDTQLKIDSYKFNGQQDGSEQSFFSLFKGGFRAVTGLIGQLNKRSYRIATPSATIGIRGTDHETFVVEPGSTLVARTPAGTYNKVNMGETTLSNGSGTISILPNQMGFAGAGGQMPLLQPVNPQLFSVVSVPAPQANIGLTGLVRESAVVDSTVQDTGVALGYTPPNVNFSLKPITATPIPAIGGVPVTANPNGIAVIPTIITF